MVGIPRPRSTCTGDSTQKTSVRFDIYLLPRPHRLVVRTPPFQGGDTSSSLVGGTIERTGRLSKVWTAAFLCRGASRAW